MVRSNVRRTLLVGAALAFVAGPLALLAQPPGGRHHDHARGERGSGHRMAERLNLTAEQQEQMEALHARHREEYEARHEELRTARKALGEAIHAETLNEAAVRKAAQALAAVEEVVAVARARQFQELRTILDAEQLAKMEEMHERMASRGHGGPGCADCEQGHHGRRGEGPPKD